MLRHTQWTIQKSWYSLSVSNILKSWFQKCWYFGRSVTKTKRGTERTIQKYSYSLSFTNRMKSWFPKRWHFVGCVKKILRDTNLALQKYWYSYSVRFSIILKSWFQKCWYFIRPVTKQLRHIVAGKPVYENPKHLYSLYILLDPLFLRHWEGPKGIFFGGLELMISKLVIFR